MLGIYKVLCLKSRFIGKFYKRLFRQKRFSDLTFGIVYDTHSNLRKIIVFADNFDEVITRNGLILFIMQPKLRERKETNNS